MLYKIAIFAGILRPKIPIFLTILVHISTYSRFIQRFRIFKTNQNRKGSLAGDVDI